MITDDEFVARLSKEQQRRLRWGPTIGVCLVLAGLLLLGWASFKAFENYRAQLALLDTLAGDRDPNQEARLKKMAAIGYRSGIFVGCGIASGYFGGFIMAYHGLVVLISPFRKERLLLEQYRSTGAR